MLPWLRKKPRPEQELAQRLAELEALAADASSGYETQYWMRAGDLCASSGDASRALTYFGRALDAYLETGRLSAADTLCRRMLETAPDAVRVRATRMWLTAARGPTAELREAIHEYVRAGVARSQTPLVVHQLRLLAEASPETEVRETLADALLDLGAHQAADRLFGQVFAEQNGISAGAPCLSDHEWGERMLEATLLRPDQVPEHPGVVA